MSHNSILDEIRTEYQLRYPYRLDSMVSPSSDHQILRLSLDHKSNKMIYMQVLIRHEFYEHKGHLFTTIRNMKHALEERVRLTGAFFKGLDHITKHIGGHPLEGKLLF